MSPKKMKLSILYIVLIHCVVLCNCKTMPEKELLKTLLQAYKKKELDGRPVENAGQAVNVSFGMGAYSLTLSEKDNFLSIKGYAKMGWNDPMLTWNPEEHSGIKVVRISSNLIWKPDIKLLNGELDYEEILAAVHFNGDIDWFPPVSSTSHCKPNVTYFPYDHHQCELIVTSWTYPGFELNLTLRAHLFATGIDMENFVSKWSVVANTAERTVVMYATHDEPRITYRFTLIRKSLYVAHIILWPSVLFSALSLVMFFFPLESESRKLFGLGLILGFYALIHCVSGKISEGSEQIPNLVIHLTIHMFLIVAVLLLTVFVEFINGLGKRGIQLPKCSQCVWALGRLVCVIRSTTNPTGKRAREFTNTTELPMDDCSPNDIPLIRNNENYQCHNIDNVFVNDENRIREWNIVAKVLDYVLFLVYFAIEALLWFWFFKELLVRYVLVFDNSNSV